MTMARGQAILLVTALLLGAALGFVGGIILVGRHRGDRFSDGPLNREIVLRRLDRALDLSPDQERAVREIMSRHHRSLMEDGRLARRRLAAARDSVQAEIEGVLNDAQKIKYRQFVDRLHKRWGRRWEHDEHDRNR